MLPFLKNKRQVAGVIVKHREPDESKDTSIEEIDPALLACAEDMLRAFKDNDAKHLAMALQAAHDICDTYEHEEGPHTDDDDDDYSELE